MEPAPLLETPTLDPYDDEEDEDKYLIPKPSEWFPKLVSLQADLIYNSILVLCHPILSIFSFAYESYHQAEQAKETVESAVQKAPSTIIHGAVVLIKKLGFGVLGAAYVCMVLFMLLILATIVGVALVRLWLEEPVVVRDRLHFDYTLAHPKAVFVFGGSGLAAGSGADYFKIIISSNSRRMAMGVPVGHTFTVSLELLMPESDFNRHIGVFQMTAEALAANGDVIAKSSQPCMLRFRSLPIRLTRTFLMGVPLILGISGETQKIAGQILRHKEGTYPRTRAIRITLSPRAGTSHLPQLYEAEIVLNSQLPWTKQLVRSWKWTLYVWASLYCYTIFVITYVTCCRPLLSPVTMIKTAANYVANRVNHDRSTTDHVQRDRGASTEVRRRRPLRVPKDATTTLKDDSDQSEDISELLRKWQRSRSKRKAIYLQTDLPSETVGTSSAPSTISMSTREDASTVTAEEDVGDSESVCT
ncbi:putative Seipin family protein [Rosa chinensis]|uniref:Putative Seipin family protein n=1 Tax=Rosa chinensis TaxID=74649 RepID=A0A2P6R527_ROSCH|nr:seipin-1 [Rosa chinensis]PRQ41533.1 putative Seipin family protein [Rosa chinensis]